MDDIEMREAGMYVLAYMDVNSLKAFTKGVFVKY